MPQKTVVQIKFQYNQLEPSAVSTNFFERFTKLYLEGWQFSKLLTMILRTNAIKLTHNVMMTSTKRQQGCHSQNFLQMS
jgi:hypothetical protein